MIYLEDRYCGIINVFHNEGRHEMIAYKPMQGYYNELLNFYNALTGKEPISVPPEVEFGDLKTIHDILDSIRYEKIVAVDHTPLNNPNYGKEYDFTPQHAH